MQEFAIPSFQSRPSEHTDGRTDITFLIVHAAIERPAQHHKNAAQVVTVANRDSRCTAPLFHHHALQLWCRSITDISNNFVVVVVVLIVLFKASVPLPLGLSVLAEKTNCLPGSNPRVNGSTRRPAAHFPGRGRLFVGRGKWKRANDRQSGSTQRALATRCARRHLPVPRARVPTLQNPMSLGPLRQVRPAPLCLVGLVSG